MKNFEKICPFYEENFITIPMFEEGIYVPFLNIWLQLKDVTDFNISYLIPYGYDSDFVIKRNFDKYEVRISIFPNYRRTEDGGYEYEIKNWSLNKLVEIANKIIKGLKKWKSLTKQVK